MGVLNFGRFIFIATATGLADIELSPLLQRVSFLHAIPLFEGFSILSAIFASAFGSPLCLISARRSRNTVAFHRCFESDMVFFFFLHLIPKNTSVSSSVHIPSRVM